MWLGGSLRNCTMRSPRSVSTTSMPCRSRNGFRWHSSVSIDLLLTTLRTLCLGQNVQHDPIVLVRIAGPVDVDAAADRLLLELLQIVGQPSQRVPLDLPGQLTQLFPFGHRVRGLVAFGTDKPEGLIVPVRPFLVLR